MGRFSTYGRGAGKNFQTSPPLWLTGGELGLRPGLFYLYREGAGLHEPAAFATGGKWLISTRGGCCTAHIRRTRREWPNGRIRSICTLVNAGNACVRVTGLEHSAPGLRCQRLFQRSRPSAMIAAAGAGRALAQGNRLAISASLFCVTD
jgi:hypothetical protein